MADPTQTNSAMPVLNHRDEFKAILKDYQMSPEAQKVLRETPFVLLVAASGAGRNTIIDSLLKSGHYHYVVSDTTRPMRVRNGLPIEQNGVQYFFRNEDDVLADLQAGKFIEAALIHDQQVSGISAREIQVAHDSNKVAITDIEVQGSATITKVKPDTLNIFVLPPSFEEWLSRIRKRSHLPEEEIKNRFRAAVTELTIALESDRFIFVINNDLDEAVTRINAIARHGAAREDEPGAHQLAAQLRDQAADYVKD